MHSRKSPLSETGGQEAITQGGKGKVRTKDTVVGGTMTCVDDNANSHFGVSDGAASKQKTLTAKASPGFVGVLPGEEE